MTIAGRLFDGVYAESELEDALQKLGVPFKRLSWDSYDCSVEIGGLPSDYRLSTDAQKAVHEAGFMRAYVNHEDNWETHYGFKPQEPFKESKGWRVSYPHKRGTNEKGIWVEDVVASWPKEWFDTGYVIIKPAQAAVRASTAGADNGGSDALKDAPAP